MAKKSVLDKVLTEIFNYEFKSGCYGLSTSEYTDEIIKSEVRRLTKHRKEIDSTLSYVVVRNTSTYRVLEFNSKQDAIKYLKTTWGETYLYHNGYVLLPSVYDSEVKLDIISHI